MEKQRDKAARRLARKAEAGMPRADETDESLLSENPADGETAEPDSPPAE